MLPERWSIDQFDATPPYADDILEAIQERFPVMRLSFGIHEHDVHYLSNPWCFSGDVISFTAPLQLLTRVLLWNDRQGLSFSAIADRLEYIARNYFAPVTFKVDEV